MLAAGAGKFLFDHVTDHPWPGCWVDVFGMRITWMSSAIASMIVVGMVLCIVLPWRARRVKLGQTTGLLEVVVLFVRDQIASPALGDKAMMFLPLLLTMFVFVLGMNLIGLVPLQALCHAIPGNHYTVGATPTAVLTVCAALASLTLFTILTLGIWRSAVTLGEKKGWPVLLCLPLAPFVWFLSLSPHVPGVIGKVLLVPLAALEFIGAIAKCFALMVRIFANMLAGHFLLAVMMLFIVQRVVATVGTAMNPEMANDIHVFYVAPVCVGASVLINLLELLVAGLQAYIYTFLSAMFLGLYVEASH